MATTSVDIRLRPLRFGFLVKPNDGATLQRIFEVNTCLWGGKYNPIIPFLERVPAWWDRNHTRFDSAKQIMNGYLEFFEPDLVVEPTPGLATALGFDQSRIISLDQVLRRADEAHSGGAGEDVISPFQKFYREQFQFVRRHPHGVVDVTATGQMQGFASCVFGAFPRDENRSYFHEAFRAVFDPELISLDAAKLEELYRRIDRDGPPLSALNLGLAEIRIDFGSSQRDQTLFVLDPTKPNDLIDFWNYRAVYSGVLAVPVQWLPKLANFCRENSRKGYRPLRGNPNGVMCHVTTMFSRSINEQDIEGLFRDHLAIDVQGANVVQTWYPPIWRPTPSFVVRTTRPMLDAGRKTLDVAVDEAGNARIEALYPEFADRFGPKQRWANVIRLRDWQNEGRIATVFPVDVRKRAVPGFHVGSGHLVSTTEGLTLYPQFKDLPSHLKLIDGNAAITAWLKEQKVQATISESGKATHQIIQTMGGIRGVGSLAQKGILTVLNDMARRPITHAFQHQKFVNLIKTAVENDIWRPRNWERLVERKVVELGYELKCPRCDSWSWHALNALGHQITCDLCLKAFNFPVVEPTKSDHARWAYRVIGPFALPDYASGGYAASLALRFLGHDNGLSGPEITWAGGHELTFEDQSKLEADFIVWHQQKDSFRPDHPTEVVFGEAKSFGRDAFETRDLNRMKSLAMRFPGSILVLATLREVDELSTGEIAGIKKLAEWGRAYDREHRHSRAPLVLLTGTELFAVHSLDMAWKDKGGAREQLVAPAYVDTSRLRVVADLTQQAYLSLPPYDEWQRQRWENKRKQKAQHG